MPKSGAERCREWYARNAESERARAEAYRQANPNRAVATHHGMTARQLTEMLERQGRRCAVCGDDLVPGRTTHVDHDHSCCPGKRGCVSCVRGVLCRLCNVGLGSFKDDPARLASAINYLNGARVV